MDDIVAILFFGLVLLAIAMFVRQVRFGTSAQRLARIIATEDGFDRDLERDGQGKVVPQVAAPRLEAARAVVDANPDDWRAWYQLGVAYGDMRRPKDARAAVRRAVALERAHPEA